MFNYINFMTTSMALLILSSCTKNPTEQNNTETVTSDINIAPNYYNLDLNLIDNKTTWDIKFSNSNNGYYNLELNSAAGIMGTKIENIDFSSASLPDSGLSYDNFIIGSNWVDSSTYNFNDGHSLQSLNNIYFIWTSSYKFIKLKVLNAKTLAPFTEYQVIIKYQELNQINANIFTDTVKYFKDLPTFYNFNSQSIIEPIDWDIGFSIVPIFSKELNSYQNMPTILLNLYKEINISLIEENSENQNIDTIWYQDTINNRILGYNGNYQVIWYHPEPPYNHKAIIEYPDRNYLISKQNNLYKLNFSEYDHGYIGFNYEIIK